LTEFALDVLQVHVDWTLDREAMKTGWGQRSAAVQIVYVG